MGLAPERNERLCYPLVWRIWPASYVLRRNSRRHRVYYDAKLGAPSHFSARGVLKNQHLSRSGLTNWPHFMSTNIWKY
eukprot:scaffold25842_cov198-Amphora_coffeaeformis.AAC.15